MTRCDWVESKKAKRWRGAFGKISSLLALILPSQTLLPLNLCKRNANMPGDETRRKVDEESDSEDESDTEQIVKIDIDPSKLTPLSPEVISKQVRLRTSSVVSCSYTLTSRPRLTWVWGLDDGASRVVAEMCMGWTGTIGHVAHGKSTVVKAISGVMTVRFKNELVRNITIKLGYANAKVRLFSIQTPFVLLISSLGA